MSNPFSKLTSQFSRMKMNLKFIILTGGLTLLLVAAVKCWYKCRELKFCDKLRNRKPSNFMLKLSSKLNCSLIGKLVNKDTDRHFDFFLTALAGGKFSIYINDPINSRYQVNDSLTEMPLETDLKVHVNLLDIGELVLVEFEDVKINLFTDPFNLTVYREGIEIIKVNPRQLLTFNEGSETAIALDFTFPQALRAYGLPEHAEKLSLRTTSDRSEPYRLYNIDRYGYEVNSTQALYGSIPVLFGVGAKMNAGVFWLNSAQTFVDITNNRVGIDSYFMSESGALETFILTGPTLRDCVKQYANLTGVAPLPQVFALGYHQSRYSYMSQKEVLEVCNKFDENKLPLDVIWMDIDYTDKKKYFTWDPKTFPNPSSMLNTLNERGIKAVAIIDPHIKREAGYSVFEECESKGYFVKNHNGTSFKATCWPELSSWIDFFNPDALNYYSSLIEDFTKRNKNLHIWNDMNEPSVFNVKEQAMDGNCIHYEGWRHRDLHNQYGFSQTLGTYRGLCERGNNDTRPFILTRSFFAGSQRYAAHWTGDNVASWEHLKISIPMILTEALCGLSFVGADVGGFANNPSEELLQRWYQAGAWYPFYRAHSAIDSERREPYLFDNKIQLRIRKALQQRYRHLIYWYTLFWEHYSTGEPVVRLLSYEYPVDINTYDIDNQFLVGRDILVHPVTDELATDVDVYLPGGRQELWYNIDCCFNGTYRGFGLKTFPVTLDTVPVFYRGGSIVPIKQTARQRTFYMKEDPVTLLVFLDENGDATGTVYDDDQVSFDYLAYKYTYVKFNFNDTILCNEVIDKEASYDQATILETVVVYGLNNTVNEVYVETNKTISKDASRSTVKEAVSTNSSVTVNNLNLDVRYEFNIKFNISSVN